MILWRENPPLVKFSPTFRDSFLRITATHPTQTTLRNRSRSAHQAIAAPRWKTALTKTISSPSARRFANIGKHKGYTGPLYLGMDTTPFPEPALSTAIEVMAANGVELFIHAGRGYTPTPVISHAILQHNRGRKTGLADGVVITPSHNPPDDGGFKYNPQWWPGRRGYHVCRAKSRQRHHC